MKILFITNLYPVNNPLFGIFVKEQIDEIAKQTDCDYDVYFLNAKEKGNYQYLVSLFAIPAKIREKNYDIIHIHYGFTGLFLLQYKPRAKVFLTLHGSDILPEQGKAVQIFFVKKILKRVYKVFVLSREMEEAVKPLKVNYEILPCGVDTLFFNLLKDRKKDEKVKLILFPADPSRTVKNYALFTEVIAYLKSNSDLVFECRNIHNLTRAGVRDLMNKADCLLMTSISEGSPQVIKEALSCGLPVVSVPVGDLKDMVNGIAGCYVSATWSAAELGSLVLQTFAADRLQVRAGFLHKNSYDKGTISQRIVENYNSALSN